MLVVGAFIIEKNLLYNVEDIWRELRGECVQGLMEVLWLGCYGRLEGHSQQQLSSTHKILLLGKKHIR